MIRVDKVDENTYAKIFKEIDKIEVEHFTYYNSEHLTNSFMSIEKNKNKYNKLKNASQLLWMFS
jgi:hypothetical protein